MRDSSVILITVLVILCVFKESKSGTICLSCSNLADGEFCAGHEMCNNNEVCFIQKYSTNMNEYRYDVGCALPELCRKDLTGNIFGKRSDHSHVLCHKCCNNTDICNARLSCNDTISVPQQKCLSCSEIEDPRMCQNTTTCGKDELCTHGYTNILGRRLIAGVHQECESCCSGTASCNHDLHCDNNTQKTINSSCSTINECNGHLVCLTGLCQCPAQFYWNMNTCIERHPVNERCTNDQQCKEYLRCEQNKCMCTNNTLWNGSLCTLKKAFNSTCSKNGECKIAFRCISNRCSCLQTDVWDGSQCTRKMVECEDIKTYRDGVYTIYPGGGDRAVLVYCIMRQTKKWTVIQSRVNGSVDFYRTWNTYKNGFGSAYGEYWLGNDNIHLISTYNHHELSIYMERPNNLHVWGNYSTFSLTNEISKYVLTVTGYTGDASFDALDAPGSSGGNANGQAFSTKDRDNDGDGSGNCAASRKSAWWFNRCEYSDLNRPYSSQRGQMYWTHFGTDISKSIIMIRRI